MVPGVKRRYPRIVAKKQAHPDTSTIFVVGLFSFGLIGPVLAAGNWYFGGRLLAKYDAEPDRWTHRDLVVAGRWMGIAGAIFSLLLIVILVSTR